VIIPSLTLLTLETASVAEQKMAVKKVQLRATVSQGSKDFPHTDLPGRHPTWRAKPARDSI